MNQKKNSRTNIQSFQKVGKLNSLQLKKDTYYGNQTFKNIQSMKYFYLEI